MLNHGIQIPPGMLLVGYHVGMAFELRVARAVDVGPFFPMGLLALRVVVILVIMVLVNTFYIPIDRFLAPG